MSMDPQRLMKFTGDLKNLPYRELMEFSNKLAQRIAAWGQPTRENLAAALVETATEINPDVDVTTNKATRPGLARGLGIE